MSVLSRALVCLVFVDALVKGQNGVEAATKSSMSIFETQAVCGAAGPESSLRAEDLTVLGLTVGASTIRDVQKQFPVADSVKLSSEDSAEEGVCIKTEQGAAAVFATGAMGAPDTLVAIYLAPARRVESSRLSCKSIQLASKMFSSSSGLE